MSESASFTVEAVTFRIEEGAIKEQEVIFTIQAVTIWEGGDNLCHVQLIPCQVQSLLREGAVSIIVGAVKFQVEEVIVEGTSSQHLFVATGVSALP